MPKAKKSSGRSKNEQNVAAVLEKKARGRRRKKQDAPPNHQDNRSFDGGPSGRYEKRIRKDPSPTELTAMNVEDKTIRSAPSSNVCLNGKRVRPSEIQELRGYPDPITTVTAEAFHGMDHDLQSTFRQVFHSLNNALRPGSSLENPNFQSVNKQLHGHHTRSSVQDSNHFFKTLVPKDKAPEQDKHVKVEFNGTNTITTNAPGYRETISWGNGLWSRTRNGVTETGRLNEEEGARLAEQTRQAIDGIIRHTANGLAGMMGLSEGMVGTAGLFGRALSPRSPNTSPLLPSEVSIALKGRGGRRGRTRGLFRSRGGYRAYGLAGNFGTSASMYDSTGDAFGLSGGVNIFPDGVFGLWSTSGFLNGSGAAETDGTDLPKRGTRATVAGLFEQFENEELSS